MTSPNMGLIPLGTPPIVMDEQVIPGQPAPRVPVKLIFGDEYPEQQDPEGMKARYLDRLKDGTEADCLAHYRMAARNLLYLSGRQHLAWNTRAKCFDDIPMAENEVRATYNLIKPIVRSRAQRLLSPKVSFTCIPDSNSFEAKDRAGVAINFLQSRWRSIQMDDMLASGFILAFGAGVVALKSYWNPDVGPLTPATMMMPRPVMDEMGQPVFDEMTGEPMMTGEFDTVFVDAQGNPVPDEASAYKYRPGDTDTAVRSVFNVRLNTEAKGFTPSDGLRWLIDEEMVPLSTARQRYPEHAQRINGQGAGLSSLTYERMAAGAAIQRSASSGDRASSPQSTARQTGREELCLLREYWQLPDADYYPEGRLIVFAGEVCVYDDVFPQGVFPYVGLYDEPAPLTWRGAASINDMVNPQDLLNRQLTSVVREMDMVGNGQFVSWDIAGLPGQISAEHGAIIKIPMKTTVAGRSIRDVFTRLEAPSGPSERWRLVEMVQQALYAVGSYHEVTRGQTPPGVDSGVAIKYLLEQEQGQLLRSTRALKNTIIQWGKQQLALARWGYGPDDERWLPVDRPDLGFQLENVTGSMLPDAETVILDLENFKPTSEADFKGEVKEAMDKGWVDIGRGLQLLDMGQGLNPLFTTQTRHYARARAENLAIEKGEYAIQPGEPMAGPDGMPMVDQMGQPMMGPDTLLHPDGTPFCLPQDDDPLIHMLVLDEIILDDTKPWPVRQVAMLHKQEHRVNAGQYLPVLPSPLSPQGMAANTPQPPTPSGPPGAA